MYKYDKDEKQALCPSHLTIWMFCSFLRQWLVSSAKKFMWLQVYMSAGIISLGHFNRSCHLKRKTFDISRVLFLPLSLWPLLSFCLLLLAQLATADLNIHYVGLSCFHTLNLGLFSLTTENTSAPNSAFSLLLRNPPSLALPPSSLSSSSHTHASTKPHTVLSLVTEASSQEVWPNTAAVVEQRKEGLRERSEENLRNLIFGL